MNTLTTTKENAKGYFIQNPMMKKFSKINEQSDEHVTYRGVAKKCGFFVLMIIAGILLTFLTNFISTLSPISNVEYPLPVVALAGISLLGILITPFITIFAKKATPVAGSIFCVSTGVIYTSAALFVDSYKNEILLAMFLTVALFTALAILFYFNLITINQKLKSTVYMVFTSLLVAGVFLGISLFIPALNGAVTAIITNPVLCIAISLISVVVASIFVLIDLQNIKDAVNNNVPKNYEWDGAFGLIFSVIWLFAEILQLVTNIKDSI